MISVRREVGHLFAALKITLCGLASTFKNETAFRQEIFLAIVHVVALYFLKATLLVWVGLSSLLAMVLSAELLNTAVECVVDLVSPDYHELAKRAKDAASAAVGVLLAAYFLAWGVFIVRYVL